MRSKEHCGSRCERSISPSEVVIVRALERRKREGILRLSYNRFVTASAMDFIRSCIVGLLVLNELFIHMISFTIKKSVDT